MTTGKDLWSGYRYGSDDIAELHVSLRVGAFRAGSTESDRSGDRTARLLLRNHITSREQLAAITDDELLDIRGMGVMSVRIARLAITPDEFDELPLSERQGVEGIG